ncbi:MAG: hypothetical protein QF662_00320 [Phycisphaerae bacterium]|jgi:hypothetical protein|nr:hypothetical protein [Phycisphaerae bacterium]
METAKGRWAVLVAMALVSSLLAGCGGEAGEVEKPEEIKIADVDLAEVADCIRNFIKAQRTELIAELNDKSVDGVREVRQDQNLALIGDWVVKGGPVEEGLRGTWRGFGFEVEVLLDSADKGYKVSEWAIVEVGE